MKLKFKLYRYKREKREPQGFFQTKFYCVKIEHAVKQEVYRNKSP